MKYDVIVVGSGSARHVSSCPGHLPHRPRRRSHGRYGSAVPRARGAGALGRRLLNHAAGHPRQHQRHRHHDRGTSRRLDNVAITAKLQGRWIHRPYLSAQVGSARDSDEAGTTPAAAGCAPSPARRRRRSAPAAARPGACPRTGCSAAGPRCSALPAARLSARR